MKMLCSAAAVWFFCAMLSAQGADGNMKAFPPAEKGMVRYVLQVPKQDDESAFKVELVVGKTVQVDAVNKYFFAGKIEEETIQGWGFPRYILRKLGPMAGTLMAVDPNVAEGGSLHNRRRRTESSPLQQPSADRGLRAGRRRGALPHLDGGCRGKSGGEGLRCLRLVEPGLPNKRLQAGTAPPLRRRQDQRDMAYPVE